METSIEKVVVIGYVEIIQSCGAYCSIRGTRLEMVRWLNVSYVGKHTRRRLVFCRLKSTKPFPKPFF